MSQRRARKQPGHDSKQVMEILARSRLYKVLSLGLAPPETAVLDKTVNSLMLDDLRRVAKLLEPKTQKSLDELRENLENIPAAEVRLDYEQTFSESSAGHLPLYETEYALPHVFAKTRAMADIEGFYRAFGMQSRHRSWERPDRASTELEFMHLLTLMEANAISKSQHGKAQICVDAERKFMQDHLGPWLPRLGKLISERAKSNFCRTLGRLLMTYLNHESSRLGATPHEVKIQPLKGSDYKDEFQCGLTEFVHS